MTVKNRRSQRIARHSRVRNKVNGTSGKPRLSVYRSLNNIYAQIIDDDNGVTMTAASSLEGQIKSKAIDLNKIDSHYRNGMLTVILPKRKEFHTQPKRLISVKK